jgi:ATP-dependent Clp protease ATP-binding subunit ClpA
VFERFTESARAVIINARKQAEAFGHHAIGVEHLLLAVLHGPDSAAADVLRTRGVTEDALSDRLSQMMESASSSESVRYEPRQPLGAQIPFTPLAKRTLELALRESLALGTNWIGPEHLLLGIARQDELFAMRALRDGWNLTPEEIRGAVIAALPQSQPLLPANRGVPIPSVERSTGGVGVVISPPLRHLLRAAAALARDEGRLMIDIDDVWLTLTRDRSASRLASELGFDETAVRAAIKRRDAPGEPRVDRQ